MKEVVFACILLLALSIAGCLAPLNSRSSGYEFWGLGTNSTTFYLDTDIKIIHAINNISTLEVEISDFSLAGESYGIKNIVAIGYYGTYQGSLTNLTYNVTQEIRRGKKYLRFSFEHPATGFLAYSEAPQQQQELTRTLSREGEVRVVLPENFTTGNLFLGVARPPQDSIQVNKSREVLIWHNPYPTYKSISVKYYPKWAPTALGFFALFLSLCALGFSVYYYYGIKALRKRREVIERDIRKRP